MTTSLPSGDIDSTVHDLDFVGPNYKYYTYDDGTPMRIVGGQGSYLRNNRGQNLLDCVAGYSAAMWGALPDEVIDAGTQAKKLGFRATGNFLLNDYLPEAAKLVAESAGLGRDASDEAQAQVVFKNGGTEAVESAIHLARRWAVEHKGVEDDKSILIVMQKGFHGRTHISRIISNDPACNENIGPHAEKIDITGGDLQAPVFHDAQKAAYISVPYGDTAALTKVMELYGDRVCGVLLEPIQGEAGIIVPPKNFIREVRELCTEHHALMIADEIQTGYGRTGKNFACQHEDVVPDITIFGKAVSGGGVAVSGIIARKSAMDYTAEGIDKTTLEPLIRPGLEGSTFGGNPVAMAEVIANLKLYKEHDLAARSAEMGQYFYDQLEEKIGHSPVIKEIRGQGLFIGLEINGDFEDGYKVAKRLLWKGLITKATHSTGTMEEYRDNEQTLRLAPPLTITRAEIDFAVETIAEVVKEIERERGRSNADSSISIVKNAAASHGIAA